MQMKIDFSDFDKLYDISPEISSRLAVFPGDTVFERQVLMSQSQGQHLDLSSIKTTVHIGAHADAVNHYGANQPGIESKDLRVYMGGCQVVEVGTSYGQRISLFDFKIQDINQSRVLFKTNSFDPYQWRDDFVSLSPEVIFALAETGVILVGIDTPSVDPSTSKNLESHKALLETGVSVLEGLVLDEVPEGEYQLIALPLKIKDADASPVRAVLLK
jgi:arylformamidase